MSCSRNLLVRQPVSIASNLFHILGTAAVRDLAIDSNVIIECRSSPEERNTWLKDSEMIPGSSPLEPMPVDAPGTAAAISQQPLSANIYSTCCVLKTVML